jgi:hypothetical protein
MCSNECALAPSRLKVSITEMADGSCTLTIFISTLCSDFLMVDFGIAVANGVEKSFLWKQPGSEATKLKNHSQLTEFKKRSHLENKDNNIAIYQPLLGTLSGLFSLLECLFCHQRADFMRLNVRRAVIFSKFSCLFKLMPPYRAVSSGVPSERCPPHRALEL